MQEGLQVFVSVVLAQSVSYSHVVAYHFSIAVHQQSGQCLLSLNKTSHTYYNSLDGHGACIL